MRISYCMELRLVGYCSFMLILCVAAPAPQPTDTKRQLPMTTQSESVAEVLYDGQRTITSCRLHDPKDVTPTYWLSRVTDTGRLFD